MKARLIKLAICVTSVGLLQQTIHAISTSPPGRNFRATIDSQNIEPAVFFYTESPQTLNAEKHLRQQIHTTRAKSRSTQKNEPRT